MFIEDVSKSIFFVYQLIFFVVILQRNSKKNMCHMKKKLTHTIHRVYQWIKDEISAHPVVLYAYADCLYRFGLIADSERIFNRCVWAYGQRDNLKQVRLTWRIMKQRFQYAA